MDLAASPCCKACVEFSASLPAEGGSGDDGLRGSGSLFLGPEVGIPSEVLKSTKGIENGVEFVPKVPACLNNHLVSKTPRLWGIEYDSHFPKGDCVDSGTPQHVVDERPYYLHQVLRRSSVTQLRLRLDSVSQ